MKKDKVKESEYKKISIDDVGVPLMERRQLKQEKEKFDRLYQLSDDDFYLMYEKLKGKVENKKQFFSGFIAVMILSLLGAPITFFVYTVKKFFEKRNFLSPEELQITELTLIIVGIICLFFFMIVVIGTFIYYRLNAKRKSELSIYEAVKRKKEKKDAK